MTRREWVARAVFLSGCGLLSACSTGAGNRIGRVDASEPLALQVHLAMRNEQAAEAELAELADPDSPRFGRFLTDADFEARYEPTPEDVAAVRAHFEAAGMTVTYVAGNRAYLEVQGTAAQAEQAF